MLLHRNHCYTILSLLLACLAFTACVPEDIELPIITPLESSKTYTVNGVSFTMIGVEGGTFVMGSLDDDNDAYNSEKPAHLVTLSSYYIGETEVTQALWQAVMGDNPSSFRGDMQRPIECVSWGECQTFISRLNELTGENFCLPTEAEWEYAARGGKKSRGYKYSGSNNIGKVAWYRSNTPGKTNAVKTKQPNELGIYDMSGNVYEWCSDWYGEYSSSAQTDPTGHSSSSNRVLRGGSWFNDERDCRVACRTYRSPASKGNDYGLRLAISSNTYNVNGASFNMIKVEGGTFTMGSPGSDSDAYSHEKPAHQVTLSSYYIGETEVTQALWQAVMGINPSNFTGDLQRPVENVSWNDCQTFISKLNELTGESFRLPTEAEWEYAARGGKESKGYKYSGSNTIGDVAWYWDNSSMTNTVKTKQPNELGIYDMSGNVYEWCSDWYSSSYYSSSPQTDPTGPSSGSYRVLRGGCWGIHAGYCRVVYRGYGSPDGRHFSNGLRLVSQFIP